MSPIRLPCGCSVRQDDFHAWAGRNREALLRALSEQRRAFPTPMRSHFDGFQVHRARNDETGEEAFTFTPPQRLGEPGME